MALEGKDVLLESLSIEKKDEIMVKAWSTIQLSLANNALGEVIEEKIANSLWKALEEKYFIKTLSNKLYQRNRLYTFKYSGEKSIQDHIDDFNKMISNVGVAGIKVENFDQAMILLISLSPSYDNFCDTILYDRFNITVKNVKEALMIKEYQKLVYGSSADDPTNELFVTRGRSQEKGSRSKSNRRSKFKKHKSIMCYHCQQIRHIKRNCPERKEKLGNSINITIASFDDSDVGSTLIVSTSDSRIDWILDSNTSFRMTPNRGFFTSYQKWEGKVKLGDNRKISIVG